MKKIVTYEWAYWASPATRAGYGRRACLQR